MDSLLPNQQTHVVFPWMPETVEDIAPDITTTLDGGPVVLSHMAVAEETPTILFPNSSVKNLANLVVVQKLLV